MNPLPKIIHPVRYKFNPRDYKIEFYTEDKRLGVTLETQNLIIRSIKPEDLDICIKYFTNPENMATYDDGNIYSKDFIKEFFYAWIKRLEKHNPFVGYMIYCKASQEAIGITILGEPDPPLANVKGDVEVSFLLESKERHRGFGFEAGKAVVWILIPRLYLRGYSLTDTRLKKVVATTMEEHLVGNKLIKKLGFQKKEGRVLYAGKWKNFFERYIKEITNNYHHQNSITFFNNFEIKNKKDTDVSVTQEEMAYSVFGKIRPKGSG